MITKQIQPQGNYSTGPLRVGVVIPAHNEEETVGKVVSSLFAVRCQHATLVEIVVVNNDSSDRTEQRALAAGARVVSEPQRGYGKACLSGIAALRERGDIDIVLFVDADGSDDTREWPLLVKPMLEGRADLVVGSRVQGNAEPGALGAHQEFGNRLATFLLNIQFGTKLTDLGPFRAICFSCLSAIGMEDEAFGWTIEMELKALRQGFAVVEIPVHYRRRQAGVSKISGTLRGSWLAGTTILSVIGSEFVRYSIGKLRTFLTCPSKTKKRDSKKRGLV